MKFWCSYCNDDGETEKWKGYIKNLNTYGSHYEIFIQSRSSIHVLVGLSASGLFACIPDFETGCHLSTLDDVFYNNEKLTRAMNNPIDGATVAYALKALKDILILKKL